MPRDINPGDGVSLSRLDPAGDTIIGVLLTDIECGQPVRILHGRSLMRVTTPALVISRAVSGFGLEITTENSVYVLRKAFDK